MQTRVVVVALVAAAVLGIFVGGVVALVAGGGDGDAQAEGATPAATGSVTADPAPPQPTATPAEDRPSPDVGYVLDVNDQDGEVVLVFDRVTVLEGEEAEERAAERGESVQPGGWYLNNDNDRTRDLIVTDAAKPAAQAVRDELDGDRETVAVVVTYNDEGNVTSLSELTLV
jgi:hypothetical protein